MYGLELLARKEGTKLINSLKTWLKNLTSYYEIESWIWLLHVYKNFIVARLSTNDKVIKMFPRCLYWLHCCIQSWNSISSVDCFGSLYKSESCHELDCKFSLCVKILLKFQFKPWLLLCPWIDPEIHEYLTYSMG